MMKTKIANINVTTKSNGREKPVWQFGQWSLIGRMILSRRLFTS